MTMLMPSAPRVCLKLLLLFFGYTLLLKFDKYYYLRIQPRALTWLMSKSSSRKRLWKHPAGPACFERVQQKSFTPWTHIPK
jgi:hypothetical protein